MVGGTIPYTTAFGVRAANLYVITTGSPRRLSPLGPIHQRGAIKRVGDSTTGVSKLGPPARSREQ